MSQLRETFPDYELCPEIIFKKLIEKYELRPQLPECDLSQTKQSRDDDASVFTMIGDDRRALLLYPKQIYEPFQHV